MPKIDKTKPVMVTGATGYVAGQLIKILLEEGLTYRPMKQSMEDMFQQLLDNGIVTKPSK